MCNFFSAAHIIINELAHAKQASWSTPIIVILTTLEIPFNASSTSLAAQCLWHDAGMPASCRRYARDMSWTWRWQCNGHVMGNDRWMSRSWMWTECGLNVDWMLSVALALVDGQVRAYGSVSILATSALLNYESIMQAAVATRLRWGG